MAKDVRMSLSPPEPRPTPNARAPGYEAEARRLRRVRVGVLAAVVILAVVLHQTGVLARFSSPARASETLEGMGGWGYLVFIVSYALLQPFGMPGTLFILVAPLVWPWPVAFALNMAGTMGCSVVGFVFARFLARDFVSRHVPERFRRYEESLAKHGFRTVFVLRFLFWMPQMLHAFLGISRVTFWQHFWGSLLGYVIPIFAVSYFGERLFEAARDAPPVFWVTLSIVMLGGAAAGWRVTGRRRSGTT